MRLDEFILLVMVVGLAAVAAFLVYRNRRSPQKILTRIVAANIILDVTAMVLWLFPETQWSVYQLGYMAAITEAGIAAAVFAAAFYGLRRGKTWAPKTALVMTIVQRVFATYIFFPSPALLLTLVWSIMLAAFAALSIKNKAEAA